MRPFSILLEEFKAHVRNADFKSYLCVCDGFELSDIVMEFVKLVLASYDEAIFKFWRYIIMFSLKNAVYVIAG